VAARCAETGHGRLASSLLASLHVQLRLEICAQVAHRQVAGFQIGSELLERTHRLAAEEPCERPVADAPSCLKRTSESRIAYSGHDLRRRIARDVRVVNGEQAYAGNFASETVNQFGSATARASI
jgi:hypothetical protein